LMSSQVERKSLIFAPVFVHFPTQYLTHNI
jgi:hypothetical protein